LARSHVAISLKIAGAPAKKGPIMTHPYTVGLELVKQHEGTSGQLALAKCILSLYNRCHGFSIAEILWPLDRRYSSVVSAMFAAYDRHGETPELLEAGEWVYNHFPRLIELSTAMANARSDLRYRWEREDAEERARMYPND
jgi:hypothetical protein